jgi:DNA gyrase subunit A
VAVREFRADRYLVFATERGTVKKTALAAYANPRLGGIIGINLEDGDRLLAVRETDGTQELLLATAKGFAIRFPEEEVRPMGRATYGVIGIRLRSGDKVVGMATLAPHGEVLTVTANAFGKRTPVADYRQQSRGGLGIINFKISDKTGEVISTKHVLPGEGLMLVTQAGMIMRINVAGVRLVGRSTQGVKLMDLEPEDRLVSMARLAEEVKLNGDEEQGGNGGALSPDESANALADLESGELDVDDLSDVDADSEAEPPEEPGDLSDLSDQGDPDPDDETVN